MVQVWSYCDSWQDLWTNLLDCRLWEKNESNISLFIFNKIDVDFIYPEWMNGHNFPLFITIVNFIDSY